MLKKRERVSRADFRAKPLARIRFRYGSISILALRAPKAAVVVSKKTYPRAVMRNRLRRRMYAAIREHIRSGRIKGSVVIYPTQDALRADFDDIRKHLADALP